MTRTRTTVALTGVLAAGLLLAACGGAGDQTATIDLPAAEESAASTPTPSSAPTQEWTTPQATADEQQRSDPMYVPGEETYAFPTTVSRDQLPVDSTEGCDPFDTYTSDEVLQAIKAAVVFAGDVSLNDSLLAPGTPAELAEAAANEYVTANALEEFRAKQDSYEAIKADMYAAEDPDTAFADWTDEDGQPTQAWRDAMDAAAFVKYDMPNMDTTRTLDSDDFSWEVGNLFGCSRTGTEGILVSMLVSKDVPIQGLNTDYWWTNVPEAEIDFATLDHIVSLQMVPNLTGTGERPWLVDSARSAFNVHPFVSNKDYGNGNVISDREYITPMLADTYPWPRTYLP